MTHAITLAAQTKPAEAVAWLRRLPQLPPADRPPMEAVERAVAGLTVPVDPTWCMARVAALLSPYYEKDTPQSVREMEAEDWLAALEGFPQWAVDDAVRWWKSADNPHRRRRPMEGDIAERCRSAVGDVRAVPVLLSFARPAEPERPRKPECREQRAAMVAEILGGAFRRMPPEAAE